MSNLTTFGLWTFLHPSMLWLGASAIVPIAIHLWSRRKFREVEWAAMQFLLAAIRQNSRRTNIEQLLLLLIRILIIVLFVLALADPHWSGAGSDALRVSPRTHYVLIFDGSYSMATKGSNGDRFDEAKRRAKQIVGQSRVGDGFSIIAMGQQARVVLGTPSFATPSVLTEIDGLRWEYVGADLLSALAQATTLAEETRRVDSQFTSTEVWIFSDLAANTWGAATRPEASSHLARLRNLGDVRIEDVSGPTAANFAVTSLAVGDSLIRTGQPTTITAEVRNYQPNVVTIAITLTEKGEALDHATCTLPPDGVTSVRLSARWTSPGPHLLQAAIRDDSLAVDNSRWLSVHVVDQVRVVCIDGSPDASRFVELALGSRDSTDSLFRSSRVPVSRLTDVEFDAIDVVFLCDVERLSNTDARRLEQFVRGGGELVWVAGSQTRTDLTSDKHLAAILPFKLTGFRSERQYALSPREYQHPVVVPFRGFERSGLLTAPTWKYVATEVGDDSRVVLDFDSGDPAIVESRLGNGVVFFVATSFSATSVDSSVTPARAWSLIATWPSFPPLIHEMAKYGISRRTHRANGVVGEVLTGVAANRSEQNSLSLRLPDESSEKLDPHDDNGTLRWSYANSSVPGGYWVTAGNGATDSVFAVNVDTRESDSTKFDVTELSLNSSTKLVDIDDGRGDNDDDWALFRFLLAGVLGLLIAESTLAARMTSASSVTSLFRTDIRAHN